MIKGWKNASTRQFAKTGKSKFAGLDQTKALSRLQLLDAVSRLDEIPALGLHKLSHDREGQWAMTINGPWRLVFTFKNGDAYDVEIVDYH
jgi:proteic killer suppression protein